jgi:hypothetical protein
MFNFDIDEESEHPIDFGGLQKLGQSIYSLMHPQNRQEVQQDGQNGAISPHLDYFKTPGVNKFNPGYREFNPEDMPGGGLDLMSRLRQRESGGDYGIRNSLGYSGAYQFGPGALEQVGLLKPGASKMGMSALQDPNNWTIAGGLEGFLSNKETQDRAMQSLMQKNEQELRRRGIINDETPQNVIDGLLAAAHLGGIGGAIKASKGQNVKDAYGTGVQDYFKLGANL